MRAGRRVWVSVGCLLGGCLGVAGRECLSWCSLRVWVCGFGVVVCQCPVSLCPLPAFFFLRCPCPLVSSGLFPCSCPVVFGLRFSSSLGAPFLRLGFTGFGLLVVLVLACAVQGGFVRPAGKTNVAMWSSRTPAVPHLAPWSIQVHR